MNGIVYDARRIKAYEGFYQLGEYAGKENVWLDALWEEIVSDEGMMKEFMYYLDHHTLLDEMKCEGYALTDLYVWQMELSNLRQDTGKNTAACNKDKLVLHALKTLLDMKKNPEEYLKKLNEGRGLDKY